KCTIWRQVCVDAMRIHPNLRNTIWPNGSIAHLLSNSWSAISVCSRIDPAFNLFGNKSAIRTRTKFHAQGCRVAIECQPLLIATKDYLNRTAGLTRKASDDRFSAYKGFCAEGTTHRWADNTYLGFGDRKSVAE